MSWEHDDAALREMELATATVEGWDEYNTVFIGYPIWWYQMPTVMQTFFDTYDFSGKTIIPFNNHAGSRDGGTYEDIAELDPNATVLDGLAISGDRTGDAEASVKEWLSRLGY